MDKKIVRLVVGRVWSTETPVEFEFESARSACWSVQVRHLEDPDRELFIIGYTTASGCLYLNVQCWRMATCVTRRFTFDIATESLLEVEESVAA